MSPLPTGIASTHSCYRVALTSLTYCVEKYDDALNIRKLRFSKEMLLLKELSLNLRKNTLILEEKDAVTLNQIIRLHSNISNLPCFLHFYNAVN